MKMRTTAIAVALGAFAISPMFTSAPAQPQPPANYCDRSGYATGVVHADDPQQSCDPDSVPRVNGVPQDVPSPYARPGYNSRTHSPPSADRWHDGRYYY